MNLFDILMIGFAIVIGFAAIGTGAAIAAFITYSAFEIADRVWKNRP